MRIARTVEAAIFAHARVAAPQECCGLLIGTSDEILEARATANASDDPGRRYLIDPREHLRAIREARVQGRDVVGAYHSHPRSTAQPSATDAAEGFSDFVFVIAGLGADPPELMAWQWVNGNFAPVPLVRFP